MIQVKGDRNICGFASGMGSGSKKSMAVFLRPREEKDDCRGLLGFSSADGGDNAFEVILLHRKVVS